MTKTAHNASAANAPAAHTGIAAAVTDSATTPEIRKFWNERSTLGELAGTNDFVLTRLEKEFILRTVPARTRVLDIGCGNAGSLIMLGQQSGCTGVGLDFSDGMVSTATAAVDAAGLAKSIQIKQHELPRPPVGLGEFDVVMTQRSLINLTTTEAQRQAVEGIRGLVKPGGFYMMIECSVDGGERTNALRTLLGLPRMDAPWHNLFFKEADVLAWQTADFRIERLCHISSTYHFVSRVLYARNAADRKEEMRYDSELNLIAEKLPQELGEFGPVKAWIWRRSR